MQCVLILVRAEMQGANGPAGPTDDVIPHVPPIQLAGLDSKLPTVDEDGDVWFDCITG